MKIFTVDPLSDPRWLAFLERDPRASIFHTPSWLEALKRTYGYQPVVLTTSAPDASVENGVALCHVQSWITGRRMVGLPFSDHCEPLVSDKEDFKQLIAYLENERQQNAWSYVELRPLSQEWRGMAGLKEGQGFFLHRLDLSRSIESLFDGFNRNSVQRKIRRQKREGLSVELGRDENLLAYFYPLFVRTRRRHGVPPPPRRWFSNLLYLLHDSITIRVCLMGRMAIASILTLEYKDVLYYKYGCSDERFHKYGGVQALFWNAIQYAKAAGLRTLDFGRTDRDNVGLVRFKDGWGTQCSQLSYLVTPGRGRQTRYLNSKMRKHLFSWMPDCLLSTVGNVIYRHLG